MIAGWSRLKAIKGRGKWKKYYLPGDWCAQCINCGLRGVLDPVVDGELEAEAGEADGGEDDRNPEQTLNYLPESLISLCQFN